LSSNLIFIFNTSFLAKKVSIERRDILTNDQINKLQQMYRQKLGPATEIYRKDKEERGRKWIEDRRKKSRILF